MKRLISILPLMIMLAMAHLPAAAQDDAAARTIVPRWIPEAGYWVAQANVNQPKQYTIFFYTNEHELIYKEKIDGVKLNLDSRRVKMRLKKVLEKSLLAWQRQRQVKENEGLVISLLQRK
jgi:hypothetical protein